MSFSDPVNPAVAKITRQNNEAIKVIRERTEAKLAEEGIVVGAVVYYCNKWYRITQIKLESPSLYLYGTQFRKDGSEGKHWHAITSAYDVVVGK